MKLSLKEIAKLIDGFIEGNSSKEILGINSLDDADSSQISYIISEKYKESLTKSSAGAIIVDEKLIVKSTLLITSFKFSLVKIRFGNIVCKSFLLFFPAG